jgi:hypothetical protein
LHFGLVVSQNRTTSSGLRNQLSKISKIAAQALPAVVAG